MSVSKVLARLNFCLILLLGIIQIAGCGGVTGAAPVQTPTATPAPAPAPAPQPAPSSTGVLRYKIDLGGTGANAAETTLNLGNVNPTSFGRLMKKGLDGVIFAEPLYVSNLQVNGGTHNVLYVATEHDIVYALDADTLETLWARDFTDSANGVTFVANSEDGKGRTSLGPAVGITGTPVIDAAS